LNKHLLVASWLDQDMLGWKKNPWFLYELSPFVKVDGVIFVG
jgi:hypothetical protein